MHSHFATFTQKNEKENERKSEKRTKIAKVGEYFSQLTVAASKAAFK